MTERETAEWNHGYADGRIAGMKELYDLWLERLAGQHEQEQAKTGLQLDMYGFTEGRE